MKKLLIGLVLLLVVVGTANAERWVVLEEGIISDVPGATYSRKIDIDSIRTTISGTKTAWFISDLGQAKGIRAQQEWNCRANMWHVVFNGYGKNVNGEWRIVNFNNRDDNLTYNFICR